MMTKEEADALTRVTAYLLDEDKLAEYKKVSFVMRTMM
jgi:hypothetical protein